MRAIWRKVAVAGVAVAFGAASVGSTLAGPPGWSFEFSSTWQKHDAPVAEGVVDRTWMWGPEGDNTNRTEEYDGTNRAVQYYDKARMEWNPDSEDELWKVTTGLLATELITGEMQVGDEEFVDRGSFDAPVAGDEDSYMTPRYHTMKPLMDADPYEDGEVITTTLDAEGNVGVNEAYADFDVTAVDTYGGTDHTVASVFWDFMTSNQIVTTGYNSWTGGPVFGNAPLFENPYYATGYPITEAYWTKAKVAGEERDVLLQCFQRRCLTYTPGNPEGWEVEMANIGQHYYGWRYGEGVPWAEE